MSFERELERWLETREGLSAIFHVEVRFMRRINLAFGVRAGDALLQHVGQQLQRWCGDAGCVTRPWGNEFTIVRAIDNPMQMIEEAQRLSAMLEADDIQPDLIPIEFKALHRYATGVAVLRDRNELEEGLRAAMASCVEAKQRGASEIVFHAQDQFRPSQTQDDVRNLKALHRCLHERSLEIHAQPIVDLQRPDFPIAKAEVLVRLAPRDRYTAAPQHLLDSARAMHVMPDVDLYIARYALEELTQHPRVLDKLQSVSINLSAQTLTDAPAMRELHQLVRFSGLPTDRLAFEITETDAVAQIEEAHNKIRSLRALGCRFVLDDFGIGFCSFGYLSQLPVDEVKIDGLFVRKIDRHRENEQIIRAIHDVATASGKRTTAEFIETPGVAERLRDIGIHYGQGWRFHPAMPFGDMEALLD